MLKEEMGPDVGRCGLEREEDGRVNTHARRRILVAAAIRN